MRRFILWSAASFAAARFCRDVTPSTLTVTVSPDTV
jgi:hypothetical protein